MNGLLDYFGNKLIKEVRDRTIRGYDMRVSGTMKDENSQMLFKEIQQKNNKERQLINRIIPEIVDLCIHNTLCMFEENEDIDIFVKNTDISNISDGLAGELYTEDGWIQKYTEQRYEEI